MTRATQILRERPGVTAKRRPLVMGILNVTPDSFSDGGEHYREDDAVARADAMIGEGADIIDVGPESTRPGATPISAKDQLRRAIPVIEAIRARHETISLSIDTRLASVARAALSAGADIVNDVSALRDDPAMAETVAAARSPVVLMHRRGTSETMQRDGGPHYDDVVGEVQAFLCERRDHAVACGIDPSCIILDPGIGFGKRVEDNLLLLRHIDRFVALGHAVLVGASRKRFLGSVLGVDDPKERRAGSLACAVLAAAAGAAILRVHDVEETVQAVRLCEAVGSTERARPAPDPPQELTPT